MENYSQVIILGAGAAGLFCASQCAKFGKQVSVFDNGKKAGRKILMSGGGYCNFTNLEVSPQHYLSQNPHFVKSALARFNQWDFITLVAEYGIAYHEKEQGQLFTDKGAEEIVAMLLNECRKYGVNLHLRQQISAVQKIENQPNARFSVQSNGHTWYCQHLIIATGGLSMPSLGATPLGYQIAEQFGLNIIPPRASLVPFTYRENERYYTALAGISLPVCVTAQSGKTFTNSLLFTHRGLSGPAILQISNYWLPNETININWLPEQNISEYLAQLRHQSPNLLLKNALTKLLPKKLVELWLAQHHFIDQPLAQLSKVRLQQLENVIHHFSFTPNGTEGYRTAEVTMGGVDTKQISSKTMQANDINGLYFIGEVLDVTGWLGGYNFQWAWSSAYACAEEISSH